MFITEYRERYGVTLEVLGQHIRRLGRKKDPPMRVSDLLLENLETQPGYKTVPKLADLIAEAVGATAEQRDSIVLEKYRGTWTPPRRAPKPPTPPQPPRSAAAPTRRRPSGGQPVEVVEIDRHGRIVARYSSFVCASVHAGVDITKVKTHAYHKVRKEFMGSETTWRLASEWDPLTPEERARRMGVEPDAPAPKPAVTTVSRAVLALDRQGRVVGRYRTQREAAVAAGLGRSVVEKRLSGRILGDEFATYGVTWRYEDDWLAAEPARQAEQLARAAEASGGRRGPRGSHPHRRAVVAIFPDGTVARYASVAQAAEATDTTTPTICQRVKGRRDSVRDRRGFAYFDAEAWDRMTEAQRERVMRDQG